MKAWAVACAGLAMLAAAIASCGRHEEPRVEARAPAPSAETAAAPTAASTLVKLDEAARKKAGIQLEAARESSAGEAIRVTGRVTVNENRTWRVGAITDGRIAKVEVNQGDTLKAGQILARMHSHEIHEGRAEYQKALGEIDRLRTQQAFLEKLRDRARRLYDLKAASLEQVEHTEADLKNGQSAIDRAEVELERARTHLVDFLGVAAEEPGHHKTGVHGEDDDLIPVRAPAAGVLLQRSVTVGSVVATAGEMFVISDLSTVWMQAAVGEEEIRQVRTGLPVRVQIQSQPGRSFPGRVTKIGDQLDAATRTLPVRVELQNAGGLLKPEMYADAEFPGVAGVKASLLIPESALQELKGQSVVFVERGGGGFEAVVVETGRTSQGKVAVTAGLAPGDNVVTRGAFLLKSQLLRKSLADE